LRSKEALLEKRSARAGDRRSRRLLGRQIFWFLLHRLAKETRPEGPEGVGETPFVREANKTKRPRLWKATPPGDPSTPLLSSRQQAIADLQTEKGLVLKPPAYTLKHHPRARRVRLRVDPGGGLIVTAPTSVRRSQVDAWVAERGDWVESVRARQARMRSDLDQATLGSRPARIDLRAVDESWSLRYHPGRGEQLRLRVVDEGERRRLAFTLPRAESGGLDDRIAARLRQWLRQRADQALSPAIESLARRHGFEYSAVSFRNQRSRWGSCSARGRLSINARLLLASPGACRYVLIHELVHTEHLNHSPAFWARVAAIDPAYRTHEAELVQLGHRLPDWL
jgi:predicted metal-dependent hydrolase